tara:strand:- start:1308 stop:1958 length:651 start_codon:yes stop_codon:yes gene_type:complete
MNEAISLENITKSFGNNLILEKLNLKIVYGEVLCISGKNGSGKSTLIRILSRLITTDSGDYFFNGKPIHDSKEFRKKIGVLLDSNMLYQDMTILENLKFSSSLYGIKNPQKNINYVSELFEISNFLNSKVKELSRGFKKRTELAKILLHKPQIIILDEPEINLDKATIETLKDIIVQERKKGAAIILCTHSEQFDQSTIQKFAYIKDRKLILSKNP